MKTSLNYSYITYYIFKNTYIFAIYIKVIIDTIVLKFNYLPSHGIILFKIQLTEIHLE